jgi:hypothetical protein
MLFCWQFLPMNIAPASSGIVDPCSSSAVFCQSGSRCWFTCPAGDGQTLAAGNNEICVCIKDALGNPIPGVLATDFWVVGCTDLCLCAGSGSIDADSATGTAGCTTISGTLSSGGCELVGVQVVCQGVLIGCPPTCLSIVVPTPDLTCDGIVNLSDFSLFAQKYNKAIGDPLYDPCADYNCDGQTNLSDFSIFAQHYNHQC